LPAKERLEAKAAGTWPQFVDLAHSGLSLLDVCDVVYA